MSMSWDVLLMVGIVNLASSLFEFLELSHLFVGELSTWKKGKSAYQLSKETRMGSKLLATTVPDPNDSEPNRTSRPS